jgi:hypothetical protein
VTNFARATSLVGLQCLSAPIKQQIVASNPKAAVQAAATAAVNAAGSHLSQQQQTAVMVTGTAAFLAAISW